MRTPPTAFWVVLLVAIAGCPSTVGGQSPTETVTPAPVPRSEVQYPPGVSGDGVSGPELAAAHERTLERTNYTLVIRQRIVGTSDNRVIQEVETVRRVRAGGEVYTGQYVRSISRFPMRRPTTTIDYWADGEVFAARQFPGGRYTYLESGSGPISDIDDSEYVGRTASALRFAVTERVDGSVVLRSVGPRDPDAVPSPVFVYDIHNVSGTLQVRPDGVVTALRIVYDARLRDREVRVIREVRVRNAGATTVERPDWVDEARNRARAGNSLTRGRFSDGNRMVSYRVGIESPTPERTTAEQNTADENTEG